MKTIKIIHFGMSDDIKIAIKDMIDQLEKNNYAICQHGNAVRFFSRFTPNYYKRKKVVNFYRSTDGGERLIRLDNEYQIKKFPNYNFVIRLKVPETPKKSKDVYD